MILGFKKIFLPKIMDHTKIHTIREDRHNRWKIGNSIQMATGVRTKNYNCFWTDKCRNIQTIEFKWSNAPVGLCSSRSVKVFIDGTNVTMDCEIIDALVKNDGFTSRNELFKWFNSDFKGKIIHWTDFNYDIENL